MSIVGSEAYAVGLEWDVLKEQLGHVNRHGVTLRGRSRTPQLLCGFPLPCACLTMRVGKGGVVLVCKSTKCRDRFGLQAHRGRLLTAHQSPILPRLVASILPYLLKMDDVYSHY